MKFYDIDHFLVRRYFLPWGVEKISISKRSATGGNRTLRVYNYGFRIPILYLDQKQKMLLVGKNLLFNKPILWQILLKTKFQIRNNISFNFVVIP